MKSTLSKKVILLGLVLFLALASTRVSAFPYDREISQVATLIARETNSDEKFDQVDLSRQIVLLSRYAHLDPLLIVSMIKIESRFKPDVRSQAGAIGLMQVMPIVIREIGEGVEVRKREDLYDPYKNLRLGIRYLTFLLEKYDNNLQRALQAYNLGPSALDERISQRRAIPLGYYRKVMQFYHLFQKQTPSFTETT